MDVSHPAVLKAQLKSEWQYYKAEINNNVISTQYFKLDLIKIDIF